MEREGLAGWYINGTDPHQSEYVSQRWRSRAWISDFTGSAGSILVTKDEVLLWVDSRYFIQGAQQIEGKPIRLMKLDTEGFKNPLPWMASELSEKSRVGIDGSTLTVSGKADMEEAFKQREIELVVCPDYLEEIWSDRPAIPATTVVDLPNGIAGFSRIQKLTMTRLAMVQKGCNYTLVSSLDDIAWITNLRSSDVSVHSPVFLSFLLIGVEKAWLFTDPARFSEQIRKAMSEEYEILPYEDAKATVESILTVDDTLYYDPKKLNLNLYEATLQAKHVEGRDFTTDLKACKNDTELEGMRRSHLP